MTVPSARRAEWEFRQTRLTYRMLCVEARTQTICRFTSLTPHRLTKWRLRWGFDENERSRGPAPSSFAPFLRSPRLRIEGAYMAVLCETFGILPSHQHTAHVFYDLTTGERLCDLFDFHRTSFASPAVSFDQLVLLAKGLRSGQDIRRAQCASCGAVVLNDPLQPPRSACDVCGSRNPSSRAVTITVNAQSPHSP